jgi:hypothetical protein
MEGVAKIALWKALYYLKMEVVSSTNKQEKVIHD